MVDQRGERDLGREPGRGQRPPARDARLGRPRGRGARRRRRWTPPFSSNGRLPSSALTAIHSPLGHATLASDAAGAWEEMRQASLTELGVDIYPAGPAVDLASPEMRRAIDQLGPRYGWAKVEAGDEWFHVNYLGR